MSDDWTEHFPQTAAFLDRGDSLFTDDERAVIAEWIGVAPENVAAVEFIAAMKARSRPTPSTSRST